MGYFNYDSNHDYLSIALENLAQLYDTMNMYTSFPAVAADPRDGNSDGGYDGPGGFGDNNPGGGWGWSGPDGYN